jgi:hypothetical protein
MNYDNADDGSTDNKKKRGGSRKKLLTKARKRSMKENFWPLLCGTYW